MTTTANIIPFPRDRRFPVGSRVRFRGQFGWVTGEVFRKEHSGRTLCVRPDDDPSSYWRVSVSEVHFAGGALDDIPSPLMFALYQTYRDLEPESIADWVSRHAPDRTQIATVQRKRSLGLRLRRLLARARVPVSYDQAMAWARASSP